MTLAASSFSHLRSGRQDIPEVSLASRRLSLRPVAPGDAGNLWRPGADTFLLILEGGDEVIGHVQLKATAHSTSGRAAELSFAIERGFRARGYATEAVAEVLRYAFEEAGFDHVVATVDVADEASARVVGRNGLVPVSVTRPDGRLHHRFVLPRPMWTAQRRAMNRMSAEAK